PALAGERIYVSLSDGRIVTLSLQTGDVIWTHKLAEPGGGMLAMSDRVYVGAQDDYAYSLDTKDGKEEWHVRNGNDVVGTPAIDAKRVYFVALDNVLRALNRKNGNRDWKRVLPMRPSSGPLLSGNTVIVTGLAAELHAYTTPDGMPAGDFVLKGTEGEEMQLAAPPHLTPYFVVTITTET